MGVRVKKKERDVCVEKKEVLAFSFLGKTLMSYANIREKWWVSERGRLTASEGVKRRA